MSPMVQSGGSVPHRNDGSYLHLHLCIARRVRNRYRRRPTFQAIAPRSGVLNRPMFGNTMGISAVVTPYQEAPSRSQLS
jgi:hypothetical protein